MNYYMQLMRHPLVKILITPLGVIAFGASLGLFHAKQDSWFALFLLYLIMISSHIIDHFFFIQYNTQHPKNKTPLSILVLSEVIMWGASIIFMLQHHLGVNALLLLYLAYIHLQYYPYNLFNTYYQLGLNIFFNAFILNNIAYFSQTGTITTPFILALIPLTIIHVGFQIETLHLRSRIMHHASLFKAKTRQQFVWGSISLGLLAAIYFALPTKSFFLAEIGFVLFSLFLIAPLLVHTKQSKQSQNKLNYLSAAFFLLSLAYAVAHIF